MKNLSIGGLMNYSIIVPVYNSERSLKHLFELVHAYFKTSYEIIFINDASSDSSLELLKSMDEKTIKIVDLHYNVGQQNALFHGLRYASGQWIITMDDDLQHSMKYLDELIEASKAYDLVYGVPLMQHKNPFRSIGSKLTGMFFRNRFGQHVRVSSFRIFNRSLIDDIMACPYDFIYLSAILLDHTDSVHAIDVINERRVYGKSGYNIKKLIKLFMQLNIYYGSLLPERMKKYRKVDPVKALYNIEGEVNETSFNVRRRQLSTECHT